MNIVDIVLSQFLDAILSFVRLQSPLHGSLQSSGGTGRVRSQLSDQVDMRGRKLALRGPLNRYKISLFKRGIGMRV